MTQQKQKVVILRYQDIDCHGADCQCGDCNRSGKSYGYGIFDMTEFGVTHTFLITEEITDALAHRDPLAVVYGPSEDVAQERALAEIEKQGWKLPDKKPTYEQLVGALQMLVGEEGELREKDCYCHEGHQRNFSMCSICWASAAYQAAMSSAKK